jgi:hypothetical protein
VLTFEFTEDDRNEKKMGVIGHRTLISEGCTGVLREPYSIPRRKIDSRVRHVNNPKVCEKYGNI